MIKSKQAKLLLILFFTILAYAIFSFALFLGLQIKGNHRTKEK